MCHAFRGIQSEVHLDISVIGNSTVGWTSWHHSYPYRKRRRGFAFHCAVHSSAAASPAPRSRRPAFADVRLATDLPTDCFYGQQLPEVGLSVRLGMASTANDVPDGPHQPWRPAALPVQPSRSDGVVSWQRRQVHLQTGLA